MSAISQRPRLRVTDVGPAGRVQPQAGRKEVPLAAWAPPQIKPPPRAAREGPARGRAARCPASGPPPAAGPPAPARGAPCPRALLLPPSEGEQSDRESSGVRRVFLEKSTKSTRRPERGAQVVATRGIQGSGSHSPPRQSGGGGEGGEARRGENCEGYEIFILLQANELACCSFVEADRRHETPGLEMKDHVTHSKSSDQTFPPGGPPPGQPRLRPFAAILCLGVRVEAPPATHPMGTEAAGPPPPPPRPGLPGAYPGPRARPGSGAKPIGAGHAPPRAGFWRGARRGRAL
ncbi:proline-rich protein 2-like [Mustela nigripes]|uniref:proline-rich protein 2-like n=1 Tax=Mustela nigripes TaxID=77151 RepID=UPI0028152484|nr:proline-rich protein 2-like [Mustela nigripes]